MTWKFRQIKPQKARGKFEESLWDDEEWMAEEKFDGERRVAQFCGNAVRFTGCRESVDGSGYVEKSRQVPHLSGLAKVGTWKFPNTSHLDGTVLDGEFVPPPGTKIAGGGSKYVTSIMGSSPEEAIRKQRERGYLCYKVFDCLWYKGVDVRGQPMMARREFMVRAVREWKNTYVSVSIGYVGAESRWIYDKAAEGVVFKHMAHTYGNERLWVKRKKAWTADVVIMGFTPGKGKYKGQVGAIEFGQHYKISLKAGSRNPVGLVKVGKCSGFDDETRLWFDIATAHNKHVGKVIEITHNGREPSGKFRHPQFSRFRPDKNPADCVYDQEET